MPIGALFEAPTIESLARILGEGGEGLEQRCLVTLRASGRRPPLFLMHALGGNVLFYRALAAALGDDQPVYALQAAGLDGTKPPVERIEEMVAGYIEEMRTVQPRGPYYLGGFCAGSYLALEAANQLLAAGEQTALLAVIDTAGRWRLAQTVGQGIRYHVENLRILGGFALPGYAAERIRFRADRIRRGIRFRRLRSRLQSGGALTSEERLEYVEETNWRASVRYQPNVFPGDLVYFKGNQDPLHDPLRFWSSVVGGRIETRKIEGVGVQILEEPFVGGLARQLSDALKQAAARSERRAP